MKQHIRNWTPLIPALLFVYFNTGAQWRFALFAGAPLIILLLALPTLHAVIRKTPVNESPGLYLAAIFTGYWLFNVFRAMGYVGWPIQQAESTPFLISLLYWHVVLSLTVLAPLLPVQVLLKNKACSWSWGRLFPSKQSLPFVTWSSVACFAGAIVFAAVTNPSTTTAPFTLIFTLFLCILKAALTAVTEELCFRGYILHSAMKKMGFVQANLFQAVLYVIAHLFLEGGKVPKIGFLFFVLFIGFAFGYMTKYAKGIGWACVVHASLDVVVEWLNIS